MVLVFYGAIRNHHIYGGLDNMVLEIRSPNWVSLAYNQAVGRAVFLLRALGENTYLAFPSF